MKQIHFLALMLLALFACNSKERTVSVTNPSDIDRMEEIVEVEIANADAYAVYTAEGKPIPCQTTYEGNLIFPATVAAHSTTPYTLRKGVRMDIDTVATGDVYPQWFDDFGWENDKIAFRTYSKTMKKTGDKLYGYDIFTKSCKFPVLDILYGTQFDPDYKSRIAKFKEEKSFQAHSLSNATTYHVDHGIGMDYYMVGPTLGCGTAALVGSSGDILYPGFYDKCELLDKGGLRLTFRLTYAPVKVGSEEVQEVRTIQLDKGSHFNLIEVEYKQLSTPSDVVVGIVLHDEGKVSQLAKGYMAYAEPQHIFGWHTYNAVIFPDGVSNEIVRFDQPKGTAQGHLLYRGKYTPEQGLRYYMGAGWNRWGFPQPADWFDHVKVQQQKYAQPLECKLS